MRISRDSMFMVMAYTLSLRATCNRLRVGAVITLDNRIVTTGYNGAPTGKPHCDNNCNHLKPCNNTIHAEQNAIGFAIRNGIILHGSTLYVTHSPCMKCSELILLSGIVRVVYMKEYRDNSPLTYLRDNGIEVIKCPVEIVQSVSCRSMQITLE